MDPDLRPASSSDLPGLSALFRESNDWHVSLVPEFVRRAEPPLTGSELDALLDRDGGLLLVAEAGGEIAGAVVGCLVERGGGRFLRSRRVVYVEEIAVLQAARRRGIGRRLMEEVSVWAAERGADAIELDVWGRNAAAVGFYRSLGYETARSTMRRDLP